MDPGDFGGWRCPCPCHLQPPQAFGEVNLADPSTTVGQVLKLWLGDEGRAKTCCRDLGLPFDMTLEAVRNAVWDGADEAQRARIVDAAGEGN